MSTALLITVLLLAASNGANDNFKGVAALYGSRTVSYRVALGWASVTTLAGSLASLWLAQALLTTFTGAGLVTADISAQTNFALAVALGAAFTIVIGTLRGLPVSTTHALLGAMAGAGLVAVGTRLHFASLERVFLLPLLASPIIAIVPAFLIAPSLRRWVAGHRQRRTECLCLERDALVTPEGVVSRESLTLRTGSLAECAERDAQTVARVRGFGMVDTLHFLLAGAVGFARGLNDTPKIAALLLPITLLDGHAATAAVAAAMLFGGMVGARQVARTMSDKITRLDMGAGLAASLTAALLVSTASFNGLPVSTTHVSVGALAGAGASGAHGGVDRRVMKGIVWSWVVTLPIGAAFGALLYAGIS
ncbi:MAG: inorganic phosphate transporter [Rudaea sp.]